MNNHNLPDLWLRLSMEGNGDRTGPSTGSPTLRQDTRRQDIITTNKKGVTETLG